MGLIWGLFSVIIASVAQLSLGFAASHLPPMTHLWDFLTMFSFWPGLPDTVTRAAGLSASFVGIKRYINLR